MRDISSSISTGASQIDADGCADTALWERRHLLPLPIWGGSAAALERLHTLNEQM
jgi:hypothetical protein